MRQIQFIVKLMLLAAVGTAQSLGADTRPVRLPKGKLALNLKYVGERSGSELNGHVVGFYQSISEGETQFVRRGELVAVDTKRNFYIYDPVKLESGWLRRLDSSGKASTSWQLPKHLGVSRAVVALDGKVWVNVKSASEFMGLPLVVLAPDRSTPLLDMTAKMPTDVEQLIEQRVGADRLKKLGDTARQDTNTWWPAFLDVGGSNIQATFINSAAAGGEAVPLILKLNFSLDGKITKREVFVNQREVQMPHWTPAGKEYWITNDLNLSTWKWNQIGVRWTGEKTAEPLFKLGDFVNGKLGTDPSFTFTQRQPYPRLWADNKRQIYVEWSRDAREPKRNFALGNSNVTRRPKGGEGEKSLTIFDSNRRLVAYMPWQKSYFESSGKWIFPLSDGSGFYRQSYEEKELRIYFHALPQQPLKPN